MHLFPTIVIVTPDTPRTRIDPPTSTRSACYTAALRAVWGLEIVGSHPVLYVVLRLQVYSPAVEAKMQRAAKKPRLDAGDVAVEGSVQLVELDHAAHQINSHLDFAPVLVDANWTIVTTSEHRFALHIMNRFAAQEKKPRIHPNGTCTTDAMDQAATCGQLNVVKVAAQSSPRGCTSQAMDQATNIAGYLEIVKYLHANPSAGCTTRAMDGAAQGRYLEAVQWLHEKRQEGCTTRAMDLAASHGYLEVIKWLHTNQPEGCASRALDSAAAGS